ncbi:MAG TPA: gamma carbonic anhydrase family protein [Polyangiales bacterium]|nr:gamma carbonic anhydrase family protein [Polyangiales bacterium]
MLYRIGERSPVLHASAYVAPSAQLIGSVVMEEESSVWFNVVVRGDNDVMTISRGANVQDGSVLHTDSGIRMTVGRYCTVGHKVMLHGCEIGDYTLIGMNAVVLNRAKIGNYCMIGANALITEGKVIPDGSVVMGSPGKIVRQVTDIERQILEGSAAHYIENAKRYRAELMQLP